MQTAILASDIPPSFFLKKKKKVATTNKKQVVFGCKSSMFPLSKIEEMRNEKSPMITSAEDNLVTFWVGFPLHFLAILKNLGEISVRNENLVPI